MTSDLRESLSQRLGLRWPAALKSRPSSQQLLEVIALLTIYLALQFIVVRLTKIPAAAYFDPVLTISFFHYRGWWIGALAIAGLVILLRFASLGRPWQSFEHGHALRFFVLFACVLIAWPLTTLGSNPFFEQSYLTDKALLLGLLGLTAWRPAFILAFVPVAYLLLWQLEIPSLGGTILAHKLQVLHPLVLFGAFLILRSLVGGRKSQVFIFVTGCLIAASYWLPALGKLQIDWLQHVRLDLVPPAAHAHGWLANWPDQKIAELAEWLYPLRQPMAVFTLLVEGAFLFFFFSRRIAILLLLGAILFHAGVFVIYGFNFWTWALLDIALLLLILRLPIDSMPKLFSSRTGLLAVLLIALGAYWAKPPKLGWHDTRLTYTFEVVAIAPDNERVVLRPTFFAPYDDVFTMTAFSYLSKSEPLLVGSYGVTRDGAMADAINQAQDLQDVEALERRFGVSKYDAQRAELFRQFVRQVATVRRERGQSIDFLSRLAPPAQFWGYRDAPMPDGLTAEMLNVELVTRIFEGQSIQELRRTVVTVIELENVEAER